MIHGERLVKNGVFRSQYDLNDEISKRFIKIFDKRPSWLKNITSFGGWLYQSPLYTRHQLIKILMNAGLFHSFEEATINLDNVLKSDFDFHIFVKLTNTDGEIRYRFIDNYQSSAD